MDKISLKKQLKQNPFILAPMDDVTDIAFRELCEENGASYTTTELISSDAFIREKVFKSRFEKGNLKINSVQFFGNNPDSILEAAKKVGNEADIIDVNFGCPSPSVINHESGAALLKDPKNVSEIVSKLVKHIDKPVTAKIRLGYVNTNHLEVAKEIEDAGAEVIAVHGRTAKQKYSGKANWDAISEVYSALKIPVVGNGDISNEEDIDEYLNKSCDGMMIGRAAIGNPLIFKRFYNYWKTGKKLTFDDVKKEQKKQFGFYLENLEKREFHNLPLKIQRQAMWFMKGQNGVTRLREKISSTKNIEEIKKLIEEF
ncbi:MAG: tRNA dihydrouridine synthase [Nanoarchaeota archaeon]